MSPQERHNTEEQIRKCMDVLRYCKTREEAESVQTEIDELIYSLED
jgi:hypothetical protein